MLLLDHMAVYLFVPAPLFAILSWQRKHKWLIGFSFLPILIFAYLFWPNLKPLSTPVRQSSDVRVMTFNILQCNDNYEAIVQVVLRYEPDLVALQEVSDQAFRQLKERLQMRYPFAFLGDSARGGTVAVFSRFPFDEVVSVDLGIGRPAGWVHTTINNQEIIFISAHLHSWHWALTGDVGEIPAGLNTYLTDQHQQVNLLLEAIDQSTAPLIILACDCNSTETASSYRLLNQTLTNVRDTPCSLANNANLPTDHRLYRLDYVFYEGDVGAGRVLRVPDKAGSDHYPIIADLWLGNC